MKGKLDSGISDFKKMRDTLQVPQESPESPCPWDEAVANSEEVSEYANDLVVTSVLLCYIRNTALRQPGAQELRRNLAEVMASVNVKGKTSVPEKLREEAQLVLDSFKDAKLSSGGSSLPSAPPNVAAEKGKRPRSAAATGPKAKKAKAKASPL